MRNVRKKKIVFLALIGCLCTVVFIWYRWTPESVTFPPLPPKSAVVSSPILDRSAASASAECPRPIHVSVVCAGEAAARDLVTAVKSLLFHFHGWVKLHLVVDGRARTSLEYLFETWRLPQVEIRFYDMEDYKPQVSWIANKHYSGVFGLMKLLLPEILPESVDRIITIDTDLIFVSNILELWKMFDKFNETQAVGLVENQSEWYLGTALKDYKPWPALGRGFNTGVMLLSLTRVRAFRWNKVWRDTAHQLLPVFHETALADQDIINAIIKARPNLVLRLPCQWNVQLGVLSQVDSLCRLNVARALHWNLPEKNAARLVYQYHQHFAANFQALKRTFLELDGNLLRRRLVSCGESMGEDAGTKSLDDIEGDDCYEMRREGRLQRRVHLYYLRYQYTPTENDVTLVTQLSLDRLQQLEDLSAHWTGPMSLAVYVSDSEAIQFAQFVQQSPRLRERRNIAYHVIYKEGQFYPVNSLRNVALKHANTSYIFLLDFDFLPSIGLYSYIRESIRSYIKAAPAGRRVSLVVPAFETLQYKMIFPRSKMELLQRLNMGEVLPFRKEVWKAGHDATDYTRWKLATTAYGVSWQADYEPYVVVERDASLFDERFVGFGWNKVAYIMELDILGYDFLVLPNAFVIHQPHAPSLDVARFRSTPLYRNCIYQFKVEYIRTLAKSYGVRALKYLSFRQGAVE